VTAQRISRADFYGAATILLILSLTLKALGVVQQALLAYLFGASGELDAYLVAVSVPNIVINMLTAGSLSLAFIPLFSEYYAKGNEDQAWHIASSLGNATVLIAVATIGAGALAADPIVTALAPGFDASTHGLAVSLLIVQLPMVGLASVSAMVKSVLYFFRRFFLPNLAYLFGSLALLGTVALLHRQLGVFAVAWGAVLGGAVALAVQLVALRGVQPRYRLMIDLREAGVWRTGGLMLGMTLAVVAVQVNIMVDRLFASYLPEGSVSVLEYAADFDKLIVSTFALSAATAAFPTLSDLAALGRRDEYAERLRSTLLTVAMTVLPLAAAALAVREPIIRVVLQRGRFGPEQTAAVAQALLYLMPALVAWALLYVALYAFFARREVWAPVAILAGGLGLNAALDALLGPVLGVPGLTLGTSVAAWTACLLIWGLLLRRIEGLELRSLGRDLLKIAAGAAAAALASGLVAAGTESRLGGGGLIAQGASLGLALGAGVLAYGAVVLALRLDEAQQLLRWIGHRLRLGARVVGSDDIGHPIGD
jgi:putative peptidoglycan lipid II flippase